MMGREDLSPLGGRWGRGVVSRRTEAAGFSGRDGSDVRPMADGAATDLDLEAFRAEARAWFEANFPKSLRSPGGGLAAAIEGGREATGDALVWRQRMGEKGWTAPTWPTQYGGGGLSVAQGRIVQQEMTRAGAYHPASFGMGI